MASSSRWPALKSCFLVCWWVCWWVGEWGGKVGAYGGRRERASCLETRERQLMRAAELTHISTHTHIYTYTSTHTHINTDLVLGDAGEDINELLRHRALRHHRCVLLRGGALGRGGCDVWIGGGVGVLEWKVRWSGDVWCGGCVDWVRCWHVCIYLCPPTHTKKTTTLEHNTFDPPTHTHPHPL
jgi:hypothetical protein